MARFARHPLRCARAQLRDAGVAVAVRSGHEALGDGDVLALDSAYFSAWWDRPETVFAFLDRARAGFGRIVWLDGGDSTGTTHFELLPFVDAYLKKQLLRDRALYARQFHGDRIYTEHYHVRHGITDGPGHVSKPLDPAQGHKLGLSWNLALGDVAGLTWPFPLNRLRAFLPASYPRRMHSPRAERPIPLANRGSTSYRRATIAYHRKLLAERLAALGGLGPEITGRVSPRRYASELARARIVASPFGWGEICFRDFETFLAGAALLKPDVGHLETWPDILRPRLTYQPVDWDFAGLAGAVEELLNDDAYRLGLAEAGQAALADATSAQGMERFARHFAAQVAGRTTP